VVCRAECDREASIIIIIIVVIIIIGDRGSTVVKVLRYKSEGRWFDPRWCHWIFP
jgi:hypothetical protein